MVMAHRVTFGSTNFPWTEKLIQQHPILSLENLKQDFHLAWLTYAEGHGQTHGRQFQPAYGDINFHKII